MLKEAIEKIEELAGGRIHATADGRYWSNGHMEELVPTPIVQTELDLTSLDALVKIIKTEALRRHPDRTVYITCESCVRVSAFWSPDEEQQFSRPNIYVAFATDLPYWSADEKLPFEEAAIALMTRYQESNDQQYLIRLLSNITSGGKITYNDNGIATTIVTQKGIALQGNEAIRPLVKLRPYRTFQELEQPESLMLVRLDERGIRFIEADGGMWKLDARKKALAYIEEHLATEIEAGSVVAAL